MNDNITFVTPSTLQVEKIYEHYRLDKQPDSPQIPYLELADNERVNIETSFQKIIKIAFNENNDIGFISLTPHEKYINLGFSVFSHYRQRGVGTLMLQSAIKHIQNLYPKKEIRASTPLENAPCIALLNKVGFTKIKEEKKMMQATLIAYAVYILV